MNSAPKIFFNLLAIVASLTTSRTQVITVRAGGGEVQVREVAAGQPGVLILRPEKDQKAAPPTNAHLMGSNHEQENNG